MSRPFSYNDENFTVIGNVVFIHCEISVNAYSRGATLCTIPPAIYDRLIYYNFRGLACTTGQALDSAYPSVALFIDEYRKLRINDELNKTIYSSRFIIGFLIMKDI